MVDQERLIKEIKSLSDSIRKKNRMLRSGLSERESFIESTFKPVIQPLKDISQKLNNSIVKEADLLMPVENIKEDEDLQSLKSDHDSDMNEKGNDDGEENEDEEEDISDIEEENNIPNREMEEESNLTVLGRDISNHGELFKKYVLKMLHGTLANRKYHVYGARLEKNGIMIGNKEVKVDEADNIIVGEQLFPGTTGLFELIFKKIPMRYSSQDLKWFKKICLITSVHKKKYSPSESIHRNSTKKYKDIIQKLFPLAKGSGINLKNTNSSNIIYYNNVNKIIERLKLLHEAQLAGHTGVNNEIVALTEELRQRGYIE